MSGQPDPAMLRRMADDAANAAIGALKALKGRPTSAIIDCMLAAVSMSHIESLRAIVSAEDIDAKDKSKLSILATVANGYSTAIMQLAQDPNTQWDDPELFLGQLEHKIRALFANAKTFDVKTGKIQ